MEIANAASKRDLDAPPFVGRVFYPGYRLPITLAAYGGPSDENSGQLGLVHVSRGTGLIEGRHGPLLVAAPAIVFLDESSRPKILRSESLELQVAYFDPSIVNGALSAALIRSTPTFTGTTEQDAYLLRRFFDPKIVGQPLAINPTLHQRIGEALGRIAIEGQAQVDENWPCRTRSFLIELLFQLRLANPAPQTPLLEPTGGDRLDQMLLLVHDRFNTDFTLDDVARWCGTNRTRVNLYFRKMTGQSLRQYIIGLRMRVASSLLRDTGLPIAEIMARVGYENSSNFARMFQTIFDQTPSQHRQGVGALDGDGGAGKRNAESFSKM